MAYPAALEAQEYGPICLGKQRQWPDCLVDFCTLDLVKQHHMGRVKCQMNSDENGRKNTEQTQPVKLCQHNPMHLMLNNEGWFCSD
ncbi:hypothetical protein NDU88_005939 [Pleurodeles waltl]|uniref:Uncharacterized protein n=1 Tax=Pleurodeles waltl TaxID=8319 RepID=A0AAV7RKL4_PLEWA|nr:hypothetical protein NDU88_005939 [Pleurodeles waltl]